MASILYYPPLKLSPSGANILARHSKVVLVERLRFGTNTSCLETPGGAVESHERDLLLAAIRDPEEETGLTSMRMLSLPSFDPNPAIQDNRIKAIL